MAAPEVVNKQVFCVACEHIATSQGGWENYKCRSPENILDKTLNLVTGHDIIRWKVNTCEEARKEEAYCGRSGKWYTERTFKLEPKLTAITDKKSLASEL